MDQTPFLLHYRYPIFVTILLLLGTKLWKVYINNQADQQFASQHGCKPLKRWKSSWPFGLDLLLKAFRYAREERILAFFLTVVEESGTTFEQSLLGARGIDTIDPENIEAVLSKNFDDYGLGLRKPHFFPLMGSGIFTQDGAEWKHSRELLRPQFSSNRFQNYEQLKQSVQNLIACIPSSGVVDLQPLFFRLTFDTTTFLLFGRSMSALSSDDVAGQESEFAEAFQVGQDYLSHRGRLGDFYWLMNDSTFRKACRTCHRFVDNAVAKALDDSKQTTAEAKDRKQYIFIDALIQETQDPVVLRSQCLNILLAGRDTTACCLSWTFRLLARHQKVLDKLRGEIMTTVGIGEDAPEPTRNELKRMTYLNLVIKEVLRLYPSVPVNSRAALRTTVLPVGGGENGKSPVLVRRGEAVGYCVYAMHRRKDIYGEDAEEFRPERWEEESMKDIGWAYLPFNGGPRVCLGQDFAIAEAAYAIVRIIQMFPRVEVPEGEAGMKIGEEKQLLTLVVASAEGCKVSLKRV
ncbi:cytochrome P450 [Delitschia confertaspora ATCC 74209]|uniref:Cytochrome P450 n=1 Tax=Delitschia confertaspora ATCC 74209 TaxID=1513339 RepID=A0A9P4JDC5_9PLEO|nr:cytochrome P450 [Delitschia confertaspora ATCC 74209]